MIELWLGITGALRLDVLLALAAAVPIGLVFGILPGLGGLWRLQSCSR